MRGKLIAKPRASLSQNFLVDQSIANKITMLANLTADDYVLEIGPGTGQLTSLIAKKCKKLLAIEVDGRLCQHLQSKFAGQKNLQIIKADILELDWAKLLAASKNWKLIANVPYHISSPIFFRLIAQRQIFCLAVVMFQKEFGQRLLATSGSKTTKLVGALSVAAQLAFCRKQLILVKAGSFYPSPKVDSMVVSLTPKPRLEFNEPQFFDFVQRAFSFRRKMIANVLDHLAINTRHQKGPQHLESNIMQLRPQQLTLLQWMQLYKFSYGV